MSAHPTTSDVAIDVAGLTKTYGSGRGPGRAARSVRALDGLDLAAAQGSVLGLLGPNGAGKSTTVKILATLSAPDGGTARVAGHDVVREPAAVRRAIGYVAQRPVTDPMGTGRENLVLAGRLQGLRAGEARGRADELLERFGVAHAADRLVKTWSGGMARKLDVAVGLVHRPQVLFLDEPTTGLDPEARAAVWAEIERMAAGDGMTILLTTHYLEEADRLADQVAIVDAGRVVTAGTPDALKDELRGDGVTVDLDDGATAAAAVPVAGRVPGVVDVAADGSVLRARADAGATALPALLAALDAAGIGVRAAGLSRPTLDDVYLRHTGRSLEAAHRAAGTSAGTAGTEATEVAA
ncbi:ABC transporter ATP-binding protein [Krasilnikoviella flava]|uniref:ABC-2 type transport system ATP-binding protein n=1 Tax=Krasilnikoviella flava TaxID=526729 RepID=A0A1T5IMM1_9MICO|nr:ATP-binding cassette domain-containing protein [Krasilnikoviella flava]SKC40248.1 ABC-2 type transport system ATP-binding protein [Krasilnikoviella flava]